MSATDKETHIASTLDWFKTADTAPQKDCDAVHTFVKERRAQGNSGTRILRYVSDLKRIVSYLPDDTPLTGMDRSRIRDLIIAINQDELTRYDGKPYSPNSKAELRKTLQQFYQFRGRRDDVQFISSNVPTSQRKGLDPRHIPTPDDIDAVMDEAVNPRDRALVALLFVGALRPESELPHLRWEHITLPDTADGIGRLHIPKGKTGPRTIDLFDYIPAIKAWQERCNGDGHVIAHVDGSGTVGYKRISTVIKEMAAPVETDAKLTPNWYRKARATYLGADLPPAKRWRVSTLRTKLAFSPPRGGPRVTSREQAKSASRRPWRRRSNGSIRTTPSPADFGSKPTTATAFLAVQHR